MERFSIDIGRLFAPPARKPAPAASNVVAFRQRSEPPPPATEATLALASFMSARKRTPKAVARCSKRVARAVEKLEATPVQCGRPDATVAIDTLNRICKVCGMCARVAI